jgi:hypothetical protein
MPTAWESRISSLSPAFWVKFDGTGTPTNSGSNGATLSLGSGTGATTSVSSPSNTGYTFNTADNTRYDVSSFAANTLSDKTFTLEAIVRTLPTATNTYQTVWRSDNGATSIILRIQGSTMGQGGKAEVYLATQSASVNFYSINRIDDGAFHHIALVCDGSTYQLFIDGFRHANGNYPTGTMNNLDTAGTRSISNAPGEISNTLTIDELVIHNSALTTTQLYNNVKTVFPGRAEIANIGGYTTTRPSLAVNLDGGTLTSNTTAYNTGSTGATNFAITTTGSLSKTASGGPASTTYGYGSMPTGWSTGYQPGLVQSFSWAFWWKRAAAPGSQTGVGFGNYFYDGSTYADNTTSWITTGGNLRIGHYNQGSGGVQTATNVCDNAWHHIVYVKDATNTQLRIYVDGQLSATTNGGGAQYNIPSTTWYLPYNTVGTAINFDELYQYPAALTNAQVSALYTAEKGAIDLNYTNTTGMTVSALMVDPLITITKDNAYSHTVSTASADSVMPVVSIGINVDGGGVSTGSALIVDPVISTTRNIEYAHTASTASATSPNATASATKTVNYSASPATASALLSSNLFFGDTNQDDTYEIAFRSITTSQNTASLGATFDGTWNSGAITRTNYIAIKPVSGFPAYNKIVKVKPNPATTYTATTGGGGRAEIYVFTANPNNSKTFTTMLPADFPAKELVYVQNNIDDGGLVTLDLTPAFADSRAATYGILIQMHLYPDFTGTIPSDGTYRAEQWYSSSNQPQHEFLYILSSDIINKNINANVITATALATDVTVTTQKYVNYSATPSTASADIVHPGVGLSVGVDAMVATLSGLMPQPAFARTVEYSHAHAEAFGDIPNPTWYAQGTITYAAAPATASALMHMPQANIGENNIVDHMNASAVFVNPLVIINESVDAMVATVSGLMIQPTINTQLLGIVLAEPMRANTLFPNPPAYLNLFGDEWYATLYAQHSVRNQLPFGYNTSFLKIFEDQNTDITQSTPNTANGPKRTYRQLFNNLTDGIVKNTGPENDANFTPVSTAITDYSTASNESRLSVGYFDPYSRKAIRMQNIAFQFSNYPYGYARADFTLEFSFKSTKANQIISYGDWSSATGPGRFKTSINLIDGKLNLFGHSGYYVKHPKEMLTSDEQQLNFGGNWVTGYKRVDDGEWHHIVIQYMQGPEMDGGIAGRTQIWIDGKLDIQRFGMNIYEPDFFGANVELPTYAPDFYTSAVSMDSAAFISERDLTLHYYDYIKYDPILAAPMTASITHTNNNRGEGNRPRALMLYWWPTSSGQNKNLITSRFDTQNAGQGEFDISMSPQELETIDYVASPPQQYFGWDVFPVDINGYFVSDLVKEEAYGGAQNIELNDLGGSVGPFDSARPQFKANRRGYFRNTKDDTRRYIDLVKDIDLSQFDMIFFKNYPDQSNEVDEFAKNQIVDPYFNIRETKIFEDFIKSLREAVDTGISLMVNNPQLALDLKIVDRIEPVPNLKDTGYYYSDPYTPTIVPFSAAGLEVGGVGTSAEWHDTYRNNRIRVLNTFTDITDWKCNIHTKSALYNNDDTLNFGGPNREFRGWEHRPNGLNVGDEFFLSTFTTNGSENYLGTPIQNVKAGTPITAFANQYRQGLNLINNPYKDYVTSIAIKPGDVLDGRQVKGKIWVNFTEPINKENETAYMDAIHTSWINLAYEEGALTLAQRDAYLASPNLLENKLATGQITQSVYNREIQWQLNGMNILSQSQQIEFADAPDDFAGTKARKGTSRKTNSAGRTSVSTTSFGGQWFTFTYARTYPQLSFEVLSMNTRGLRWLSDRVAAVEQNQAHTAMPASGTMIQPTIIAEKEVVINTQAMLAIATKIPALGYAGNDVKVISLPFQASAIMTAIAKLVSAAPMTAAAVHRDSIIRTTASDQVIVYVLHEDPILYLREDIIK